MNKKMQMVLFGVIAIAAVYMLTKKPAVQYIPPVTGNVSRDSTVSSILAIVAAAGASAPAIANLINMLSNSSDSQIQQTSQSIQSNGVPSDWLA